MQDILQYGLSFLEKTGCPRHILKYLVWEAIVLLSILSALISNLFLLILHVTGSDSFPRPLSVKEEQHCLENLKSEDEKIAHSARSQLIEHNLRLVAHVVKKYYAMPYDQNDLISIGTIGLIKAVNTFCPERNIKLATYASRCIENEILMYLRKNTQLRNEISIDDPLNVDWDGNELLLSDVLGSDQNTVNQNIEREVEKQLLMEAVSNLSEREQKIMHLRFGLNETKEHTQKEVADCLGISQSYISRLEKRIMERLRKDLERVS